MPVGNNQGVPFYGGSGLIEVPNQERTQNHQSHVGNN